jgi:hypothetical protein
MTVTEYKIDKGPRRGVTLFEVEGFNFDSRKEAEDFARQPWPRQLPVVDRLVTSDHVSFSTTLTGRKRAKARQQHIDGKR